VVINYYNNQLSREHIKYVLGIDVSLNEGIAFTESEYKLIIEKQLIYESFLTSLAKNVIQFVKDPKEYVVTKITSAKEFFITIGRILSTPNALRAAVRLVDNGIKKGVKTVITKISNVSEIVGEFVGKLLKKAESLYFRITEDWARFVFGLILLGGFNWIYAKIINYINKFKNKFKKNAYDSLAPDEIKNLEGDILSIFEEIDFSEIEALYSDLITGVDPLLKFFKEFSQVASEIWDAAEPLINQFSDLFRDGWKGGIIFKKFAEINENINNNEKVVCDKCGHDWKIADGGKDVYLCHLCGQDNTPPQKSKFEDMEELHEGEFCPRCLIEYILEHVNTLEEAEYKGRNVQLGKPMAGDVKKFKVYVKNKAGKVIKVNFGQKGVKIKKNNPARRKSFRARHKCHTANDRTTPRYWSCRAW
jgi:hypothetical protein